MIMGRNINHQLSALLVLMFAWISSVVSAQSPMPEVSIERLKQTGIVNQLTGDYEQATVVSEQIKRRWPDDPLGYTLNLNTLLTQLTWDRFDKRFDATILDDANKALSLCNNMIDAEPDNERGYYLCGQSHFALTYLHAVRGNYLRAGSHGSRTIARLEQTLERTPDLIDAKLYLGAAYYFADNLPPFIKSVSPLLWFIPTGDSAKSLPYIDEVTRRGAEFKEPAKYLYSNLLLQGDESGWDKAGELLAELVERYPQSRRFQLRYISYLVTRQHFSAALKAAEKFIDGKCCERKSGDVLLASLWQVRSYLGLNDADRAIQLYGTLSADLDNLPTWGRSWYLLTRAQINDLLLKRDEAIRDYERVLASRQDGFVAGAVAAAANTGIAQPFVVDVGSARQ